jgi:hypothetical protein
MSTAQTPEQKAQSFITTGDEAFAANKFDNAKSAYDSAYSAITGAYGHVSPLLLPILDKLVAALYARTTPTSTSNLKEIGKFLKMSLAITQQQHGVRSAQLIPILEKLVVFYDFDGAHMLAVEVLQRIDDIKANLEVGQG